MTAQTYTSSTTIKARLGITDSTDDTLLGVIAGQVNSWLEERIGFPVGPITSEERLFDGSALLYDEHGIMYLNFAPFGCRAITAVRTADTTGGSYTTQTASDVVLRPHAHERKTDWPAFRGYVKDSAAWDWTRGGYDTNGVTATWGWAAIPAELSAIADKIAIAMFRGRGYGSGQAYAVGEDAVGSVAAEELSATDWRTIGEYQSLKMGIA